LSLDFSSLSAAAQLTVVAGLAQATFGVLIALLFWHYARRSEACGPRLWMGGPA
jgi:hypothetical protein